ncbi:MAG: hypothetical protein M3Z06_15605 [Actinomycetota bacterium]|nr:hypothetical protein [Actinomycetota bacterium]
MPSFCRHNRLIQNCPICSREQSVELRPVVSSGAPRTGLPRAPASPSSRARSVTSSRAGSGRVTVSQLARGADDGFRSGLAPGLKSSEDAERLARELAFAAARLVRLGEDPPGLYAEVASPDLALEERTWLAFQIAYVCPLDGEYPFRAIESARTTWSSGEMPDLETVEFGPRSAHDPARGTQTLDAYRAWAGRSGSQAAAFTGDGAWTAERRFARVFERLALPGMSRDVRFELLVLLGRLGAYELSAASLQFGGANETTVAAKRALGIGDSLLLERRASELAQACGLPLEALDLGLHNWGVGRRATLGMGLETEPDPAALQRALDVLGL